MNVTWEIECILDFFNEIFLGVKIYDKICIYEIYTNVWNVIFYGQRFC